MVAMHTSQQAKINSVLCLALQTFLHFVKDVRCAPTHDASRTLGPAC